MAKDKHILNDVAVKRFLLNTPNALADVKGVRNSKKFAQYLAWADRPLLVDVFFQLLHVFVDQGRFAEFTSVQHQFDLAVSIIDFAKEIQ